MFNAQISAETVSQDVHLSDDVDEVEQLADKEGEGVAGVGAAVHAPVLDDVVDLVGFAVGVDNGLLRTHSVEKPTALPTIGHWPKVKLAFKS
jgi:hypothetical protein